MDPLREVVIRVHGPGFADIEIADLSRDLREALFALDIEDARPAPAPPPPAGAKAGDAFALGTLLVSLAPILIAGIVDVVASWLRRQPDTLEVDIGDVHLKGRVTADERAALVAALVHRVSGPAEPP
jgi:hypothetical protein